MRMLKLPALCMSGALAACAGNGDGLDESGRPEEGDSIPLRPTFASIQDNVFTPLCTGCHAGAAAPLGLRLDSASSYALLVNAPSVEVPSLRRVQPGNPAASYLIQKLEGTAPVGSRMPLNATPLPQSTMAVIRQWIIDGAANAAAVASGKPDVSLVRLTAISPAEAEKTSAPGLAIVIAASTAIDTALLQSELFRLRGSGGDGEFDAGNEVAMPLEVTVRSQQPSVFAIAPRAALLPPDRYELRISGTDPVALADYRGQPIDGDGDGTPGGDFVLHFTVEETP